MRSRMELNVVMLLPRRRAVYMVLSRIRYISWPLLFHRELVDLSNAVKTEAAVDTAAK